MIFEYFCEKCQNVLEKDFRVGQADKFLICENCSSKCERHYSDANFILKGGGWTGKTSKMNREQTLKNENAGKNMEERWRPTVPKLIPNINGEIT